MAWLKNFSTKKAIPATQLKWNDDDNDTQSIADVINAIKLSIYPVGAIYTSVDSTDPSTLFGGTWERLRDRFLLGAGETYTAGATGGEATHTLTTDEMPAHSHGAGYGLNLAGGSATNPAFAGGQVTSNQTSTEGGGQPHNNMPPYLVVYMWKRTA